MGSVFIIPNFYPSDTLGKVTLKNEVEVKSISIVGNSSVVGTSATYNVSFYPIATTQRGVTWSIESGGNYATINSSTGVLSVLSGASSSAVTIKATSTANQAVYATKQITVTYSESGYSATVIYSQVNQATNESQIVDFDIIAEDNWMILAYRTSVTYVSGQSVVSDFFTSDGGIGYIHDNSKYLTQIESATTAAATSKTRIYSDSKVCNAIGFKKANGTYYYTLNGTTWTSFQCHYYSGKSSTKMNVIYGRSDKFTNDVYGFYLYSGVDDNLVSDFFNQHG